MKKLIRMITPFIAMLFLVACSSSDSVINDIVDDIVDNPTTSDSQFTSDILVGKTYTMTEDGLVTTVTFSETEITIEEDGETFTLSYSINADGLLVIDGNDVHILISIDENGDLHVENEGVTSVWTLMDGITQPVLDETLIVGETKYFANSAGVTGYRNYAADGSYTGSIVPANGTAFDVSGTYEIVNNVLTITRTSPSSSTLILTYTGEEAGGLVFTITIDGGEAFQTVSFATAAERDAYVESLASGTDPTPIYTSDMLVGKTYTMTEDGTVTTVTFTTETEVSIEEDGETFILPYSINADGVLVLDGSDLHTLISIDDNGDLHVENGGVVSVWVLST